MSPIFARRPRRAVLQQRGRPFGMQPRAKTLGAFENHEAESLNSRYEVVVESEMKRLTREVEQGLEEKEGLRRDLDEAVASFEAVCEEVERGREECWRKDAMISRLRERVRELERDRDMNGDGWQGKENWNGNRSDWAKKKWNGFEVMNKIESGEWWEMEIDDLENELRRERWMRGMAEGEVRRLEGVIERWDRRWERERGGLRERERLIWARLQGVLKVWEGERGGKGVFVGEVSR